MTPFDQAEADLLAKLKAGEINKRQYGQRMRLLESQTLAGLEREARAAWRAVTDFRERMEQRKAREALARTMHRSIRQWERERVQ